MRRMAGDTADRVFMSVHFFREANARFCVQVCDISVHIYIGGWMTLTGEKIDLLLLYIHRPYENYLAQTS